MKYVLIVCAALFLFACGDGPSKTKKFSSNNGNNVNNSECGDGVLQDTEACDPQIVGGEGACPDSCAAPACATAELVGDSDDCTAECIITQNSCGGGDGCCPMGCDSSNDPDCTNLCGNGTVEPPETCDGNCLDLCDDNDACTFDTGIGNADQCNIVCEFRDITTCAGGDGCCPDGCTNQNDSDCAVVETCGNGTLEPGELCDGDCPTTCVDNDACTQDSMAGSPDRCNVVCQNTPISACTSGDGCCPTNCTFNNDTDCMCQPMTCQQMGFECGIQSNGCPNGTVNCGGCPAGESCQAGTCVSNQPGNGEVGSPCTANNECTATNMLPGVCEQGVDWPGGYCTIPCIPPIVPCGANQACADLTATNMSGTCLSTCNTAADCRPGYQCATAFSPSGTTVRVCYNGP